MIFDWPHLFVGLGIGLIMSAPIGPVNFLCFQRTLHGGLFAGMMVGVGSMLADVFFASISIFGLKYASQFIENNIDFLQLAGGVLIIAFGIYLLNYKARLTAQKNGKQKAFQGLLSGFVMTVSNPGNFFGFVAMFSGITDVIANESTNIRGIALVVGVALGASLWWSAYAGLVWTYRNKITQDILSKINKIAGVLIVAIGIVLISRNFIDFFTALIGV